MRFRATGVSPWGLQWEKKDDDREIARRVLNLFGDRRMLWKDFSAEVEEHCVNSAIEVRRALGEQLNNPEIGRDLADQIRAMQALFRSFLDEVGPEADPWHRHHGFGTDPLSIALGRLRGLLGVHVGVLASRYGVDVPDDLATIVPDEAGWFFERFRT